MCLCGLSFQSDVWTEEEERILIEAHESRGNKWSQITKLLPGRTENAIKNHWNAATRKKTMRLNRNKKDEPGNAKPKSTLLRDYIRGMSSSSTITAKKSTNSNVQIGEFTIPPDHGYEQLPSSFSSDSPSIDLIPNYDEEFSFNMIENLFSTGVAQGEITTSTEHMVQALEPQLQTNMNPQGFIGNAEHGTSSSSILIENSFDMHLNNNYQTATQLFSDAYLPYPVSEPATFSNYSSEPVYAYGDMNMDLAFNAQGGGFSSS
ncbi:hypothetical protein L1987_21261 [Smallanthus sonchifolius]|uniref:Uncharacterized protein n=1 Tax=Smallanthus sonchifolius TaxID=185202 RepID=A0ACB9ITV9_9ASTR|nr:hypothetical protein L1987_21261 [Smallanthus sonchifolius]